MAFRHCSGSSNHVPCGYILFARHLKFKSTMTCRLGLLSYSSSFDFNTHLNCKEAVGDFAKPASVLSNDTVSSSLPDFLQNSFASWYTSPLSVTDGPKPTWGDYLAKRYKSFSTLTIPDEEHPNKIIIDIDKNMFFIITHVNC